MQVNDHHYLEMRMSKIETRLHDLEKKKNSTDEMDKDFFYAFVDDTKYRVDDIKNEVSNIKHWSRVVQEIYRDTEERIKHLEKRLKEYSTKEKKENSCLDCKYYSEVIGSGRYVMYCSHDEHIYTGTESCEYFEKKAVVDC